MFLLRWLFPRSFTAHPNFAVTEQMVLADDRAPLPGSGSKEKGLEEKNRVCREQLYEVIREAMTRSGILSASYKFKILWPERPASSYLVMIDLSGAATGSAFRPADTEAHIVQRALKRHALAVSAVYWRLHAASSIGKAPDFTAGQTGDPAGPAKAEKFHAPKPARLAASAPAVPAGNAPGTQPAISLRAYEPLRDFEETECMSSGSYPALGATQYGELH